MISRTFELAQLLCQRKKNGYKNLIDYFTKSLRDDHQTLSLWGTSTETLRMKVITFV